MKRTIIGLVTTGLLALGGSVGLAVPATAATADCPLGYSCQWRDTGYRTGSVEAGHFSFFECQYDFSWRTYAGVGGNGGYSVSSVSNKGRYEYAFYYINPGYQGPSFGLKPGSGDGNLGDSGGNAPAGFNDELLSGAFGSVEYGCK
ncbi:MULTISPECIES: hypothetical protein [Cellulosimicrobium]|uniref:Peptidase inhibitor family I36 n=1 Tax=Cellulosimicrobium sp. ES-005 TaxID=3163031 RepID=A0AAU8G1N5_9MICO|nr:hypothetical protein [Cellulosimicrobium cellulans]MCO7274761.1 hypothetical protein [Cellulosimicrobium cellulans]